MIHYAREDKTWLGNQVISNGLYHSNRTFRWMKRYITARSPGRKRIDGREISHFDAGRDFLSAVIALAGEEVHIGDEEIALTVPVEAFEDYENWISEAAEGAGHAEIPNHR